MNENQSQQNKRNNQRSTGRKLAEWVSLSLSVVLILGLAGYLLFEALQPNRPYVPAQTRPLMKEVREEQGHYILPIEVANRGERTLRDLQVGVEYRSADGKPEKRELTIDYLGERSKQKIYVYFDRHPRELQVQVKPLTYRLD